MRTAVRQVWVFSWEGGGWNGEGEERGGGVATEYV